MSRVAKAHLEKTLKAVGFQGKIHNSYKSVELDRGRRIAAVLYHDSDTQRDGSKTRFQNEQGITVKRVRKYVIKTKYIVLIAESSSENCDKLKDTFLQKVGTGCSDGIGNWIYIDVLDADYEEEKDSVLRGKAVAMLMVECTSGIYEDTEYIPIYGLKLTVKE